MPVEPSFDHRLRYSVGSALTLVPQNHQPTPVSRIQHLTASPSIISPTNLQPSPSVPVRSTQHRRPTYDIAFDPTVPPSENNTRKYSLRQQYTTNCETSPC